MLVDSLAALALASSLLVLAQYSRQSLLHRWSSLLRKDSSGYSTAAGTPSETPAGRMQVGVADVWAEYLAITATQRRYKVTPVEIESLLLADHGITDMLAPVLLLTAWAAMPVLVPSGAWPSLGMAPWAALATGAAFMHADRLVPGLVLVCAASVLSSGRLVPAAAACALGYGQSQGGSSWGRVVGVVAACLACLAVSMHWDVLIEAVGAENGALHEGASPAGAGYSGLLGALGALCLEAFSSVLRLFHSPPVDPDAGVLWYVALGVFPQYRAYFIAIGVGAGWVLAVGAAAALPLRACWLSVLGVTSAACALLWVRVGLVDVACACALAAVDLEAWLAWQPSWTVLVVGLGALCVAPGMDSLWLGTMKANASYGWFQCVVGVGCLVWLLARRFGAVVRAHWAWEDSCRVEEHARRWKQAGGLTVDEALLRQGPGEKETGRRSHGG